MLQHVHCSGRQDNFRVKRQKNIKDKLTNDVCRVILIHEYFQVDY